MIFDEEKASLTALNLFSFSLTLNFQFFFIKPLRKCEMIKYELTKIAETINVAIGLTNSNRHIIEREIVK